MPIRGTRTWERGIKGLRLRWGDLQALGRAIGEDLAGGGTVDTGFPLPIPEVVQKASKLSKKKPTPLVAPAPPFVALGR